MPCDRTGLKDHWSDDIMSSNHNATPVYESNLCAMGPRCTSKCSINDLLRSKICYISFQSAQVSGANLGASCRSSSDCSTTHAHCEKGLCVCDSYFARVSDSTCLECKIFWYSLIYYHPLICNQVMSHVGWEDHKLYFYSLKNANIVSSISFANEI